MTEIRQVGANPGVDDLFTAQEHTVFGDLLRTTLPKGNVIEYGYDTAGRLISIERKPDASTSGERTLYTLDDAGNRQQEQLQRWDAGSSTWVTESSTSYQYSTRCQAASMSRDGSVTSYGYDCNGNLDEVWDPSRDPSADPPSSTYVYDNLNRLSSVTQPWGGSGGGMMTTSYGYDVQDHLTSVTDAEGNTTSYTYSDRDLLTTEVSPVSGTTSHSYNEHGELETSTDARSVTVNRTIDALDRVTLVDYTDNTLDTSFSYDTAPGSCSASVPVGRLGTITRNGGTVDYCYDRFGRVTQDGDLGYDYDPNGNRTQINYPGSVTATYSYDYADRQESLSVQVGSSGSDPVTQVASGATYEPSGPLTGFTLGNGLSELRAYDGRYAPERVGVSGTVNRSWIYTTDDVGNVLQIVERDVCPTPPLVLENQTVSTTEQITHCSTIEAGNGYTVDATGDVSFQAGDTIVLDDGFSVLDGGSFTAIDGGVAGTTEVLRTYTYQPDQYFLTSATGPWGSLSWTYDQIGNRLSETRNGSTDSYLYTSNGSGNTPILDQISLGVGGTRDYTWDAAGNLDQVAAGANVIDFSSIRPAAWPRQTAPRRGRPQASSTTAGASSTSRPRPPVAPPWSTRSTTRAASSTSSHARPRRPIRSSERSTSTSPAAPSPSSPSTAPERPPGPTSPPTTWAPRSSPPTPPAPSSGKGASNPSGPTTRPGDHGRGLRQRDLPPPARPMGRRHLGRCHLRGAGVYYNVHRWYQPATGRYTRPDPIGLLGAVNLYGYVRANPLRWFDPLGLRKICCQKTPEELLERAQERIEQS